MGTEEKRRQHNEEEVESKSGFYEASSFVGAAMSLRHRMQASQQRRKAHSQPTHAHITKTSPPQKEKTKKISDPKETPVIRLPTATLISHLTNLSRCHKNLPWSIILLLVLSRHMNPLVCRLRLHARGLIEILLLLLQLFLRRLNVRVDVRLVVREGLRYLPSWIVL